MRRQQRHRQQPAAQPAELGVLPHDVTVRDDVGTADLEHFTAGLRPFQGRRQVLTRVRVAEAEIPLTVNAEGGAGKAAHAGVRYRRNL